MLTKKASAFDLDHTLVRINTSFAFCKYLVRVQELPVSAFFYAIYIFFRHRLFGLSLQKMHEKIFQRVLVGKSAKILEKHGETFCKDYLIKKLYMPAVDMLNKAKQAGHYTLLLSSSPTFLVKPFADFFCVDEWKGTEYGVDQSNRLYTIKSLVDGAVKAGYLISLTSRLGISKKDMTAYSDSYLDISFLLSAGEAVAVNPDRKLKKIFQRKNWRMI